MDRIDATSAAAWLLALALAAPAAGVAATTPLAPTVRVLEADRPLDASRPRLAHVEPHLAVDPDDPRRLLVGTIVRSPERGGPWHCAVLSSADGGETWTRRDLVEMDRCIDPWVLFTPGGERLFSALEIRDEGSGPGRFALLAWRSEDDGASWSGPDVLGRSHERPILAAAGGRIWAVSRRMYAGPGGAEEHALGVLGSTDDGRSFVDVSVQRPVALGMTPAGLVAGPEGRLRIGFRDHRLGAGDDSRPLGAPRVWLLSSPDGGRTFGAPVLVTEACGHAEAFPGYPALDGAGDHLVLACVRGELDGLAVVRSTDGGTTWSDPVRVAAGAPGAPAHVRTPMLAVAGDGTVGLAWYDRRNDPERRCQDVYFAASSDGGARFDEPLRISTETSCPGAPGNGVVADSWPMGGDYGALAATPEGGFRLVWADSRSGVSQLRHAKVGVEDRPGPGAAAGPAVSRPPR